MRVRAGINAFANSDPGVFRDLEGLGLERDLTDYCLLYTSPSPRD